MKVCTNSAAEIIVLSVHTSVFMRLRTPRADKNGGERKRVRGE